jgi:hypothetical protein
METRRFCRKAIVRRLVSETTLFDDKMRQKTQEALEGGFSAAQREKYSFFCFMVALSRILVKRFLGLVQLIRSTWLLK